MEHNLDHIFNPTPHKPIYLCQIGKSVANNFTIGLAFDHENFVDIQKQYQGKITKILLLRTSEDQYNHFRRYIIDGEFDSIKATLYYLLSNSLVTNHMN